MVSTDDIKMKQPQSQSSPVAVARTKSSNDAKYSPVPESASQDNDADADDDRSLPNFHEPDTNTQDLYNASDTIVKQQAVNQQPQQQQPQQSIHQLRTLTDLPTGITPQVASRSISNSSGNVSKSHYTPIDQSCQPFDTAPSFTRSLPKQSNSTNNHTPDPSHLYSGHMDSRKSSIIDSIDLQITQDANANPNPNRRSHTPQLLDSVKHSKGQLQSSTDPDSAALNASADAVAYSHAHTEFAPSTQSHYRQRSYHQPQPGSTNSSPLTINTQLYNEVNRAAHLQSQSHARPPHFQSERSVAPPPEIEAVLNEQLFNSNAIDQISAEQPSSALRLQPPVRHANPTILDAQPNLDRFVNTLELQQQQKHQSHSPRNSVISRTAAPNSSKLSTSRHTQPQPTRQPSMRGSLSKIESSPNAESMASVPTATLTTTHASQSPSQGMLPSSSAPRRPGSQSRNQHSVATNSSRQGHMTSVPEQQATLESSDEKADVTRCRSGSGLFVNTCARPMNAAGDASSTSTPRFFISAETERAIRLPSPFSCCTYFMLNAILILSTFLVTCLFIGMTVWMSIDFVSPGVNCSDRVGCVDSNNCVCPHRIIRAFVGSIVILVLLLFDGALFVVTFYARKARIQAIRRYRNHHLSIAGSTGINTSGAVSVQPPSVQLASNGHYVSRGTHSRSSHTPRTALTNTTNHSKGGHSSHRHFHQPIPLAFGSAKSPAQFYPAQHSLSHTQSQLQTQYLASEAAAAAAQANNQYHPPLSSKSAGLRYESGAMPTSTSSQTPIDAAHHVQPSSAPAQLFSPHVYAPQALQSLLHFNAGHTNSSGQHLIDIDTPKHVSNTPSQALPPVSETHESSSDPPS